MQKFSAGGGNSSYLLRRIAGVTPGKLKHPRGIIIL